MKPLNKHIIGPRLLALTPMLAWLLVSPATRAEAPESSDVEEEPPPEASDVEATESGETEDADEEMDEEGAGEAEKAKEAKKAKKKPAKSDAKVLLPASEKGASVMLDGAEVGVTPLPPLTGLTVGTHELRVDKEGFYTYTAEIEVPDKGDLRHDILLDGGASQKTELPAFMKTWWFWTAVGAVVLTGATVGIYYGVKEEPPDAVKFPPY